MNTLGLSMILKMGCICTKEHLEINGKRYTVLERLGEGGFSCVDLVENTSNKKKYAVKRIVCHSADDEKITMDEIRYYTKLKHPNIIKLVDFYFTNSKEQTDPHATSEAFLVLPYYKRGTLHDYLTLRSFNRNYLNEKDVLRIFLDVCDAIKYLHDFAPDPIAHRDLKTANICLTEQTDPILMDLGSCAAAKVQVCGAQDAQKLQDLAAERCSMTYRAPELFHVESYCIIDQRVDIWSLGCVLYAMMYFKSPFDIVYEKGDSVNLAALSGTVSYPGETPFCEDMHELVRFCLKVDPSQRPFIDAVIEKAKEAMNKIEIVV
ncbi:unnamed protein product [Phyllotreta striolata]|uniref:non-specific serine/threonine protein kinase n=1 Tax=Phyllotreta striolata TaxID=444603 RepID=A0A9N9XMG4_PHYSR|nr:unnamed protein product [Phyllotreta striolata]